MQGRGGVIICVCERERGRERGRERRRDRSIVCVSEREGERDREGAGECVCICVCVCVCVRGGWGGSVYQMACVRSESDENAIDKVVDCQVPTGAAAERHHERVLR